MDALPETPSGLTPAEELLRLRELVNAFAQLNTSLDLEVVLRNTLETATALMKAEVGSIALINAERTHLEFVESTDTNFARLKQLQVPIGEGIAGDVAKNGRSVRVEDVRKDARFYGKIDENLGMRTQSYLCVPLLVEGKVIGTAQIMNRIDGRAFTVSDEKLLEGFARQASLAIHNARMHHVLLEQKAIESELEVCAQIQRKLFPQKPPEVPGFQVFGASVPCRQVGGDYYSFVPRPNGSYDVVIADVSGKGLSAALMVSEFHTGFHMVSQMDCDLRTAVRLLDEHMTDSLITGKFITAFIARLDPARREIEYALAGHPGPFVVQTGSLVQLEITGTPFGIPRTPPLETRTCTMDPGGLLIAYTDGYSEAQSPAGDLYDDVRVGEIASEHFGLQLPDIVRVLDEDVGRYTHDAPPPDDATVLLLRRA